MYDWNVFLCLNVAFTQKHCCKKVQFINLFANRDKTVLDKLLLQIRKKLCFQIFSWPKDIDQVLPPEWWLMFNHQILHKSSAFSSWRKVNIQSRIISDSDKISIISYNWKRLVAQVSTLWWWCVVPTEKSWRCSKYFERILEKGCWDILEEDVLGNLRISEFEFLVNLSQSDILLISRWFPGVMEPRCF